MSDWKNKIPYPYKGHTITDPKYIKDRNKTFRKNGNGWWIKGDTNHRKTNFRRK